MNFRLTAALFGIVFLIGVVLLLMSFSDNKEDTGVLAPELANAGVKTEDVDSVEFEKADGTVLQIVRTDKERNNWQIRQPLTAKADAAKVLPIVTALLKTKPIPYTELSTNPAVHGLDPPGLKVTIRQGERASTVNLGDVTFGGDKGVVFVTTSAQSKRPMAVRRSDLDVLFRDGDKDGKAVDLAKWTSDFRNTAVFPSDSRAMGEDVALLKLELPNKKQVLALARTPSGGWKFDSPAGWGEADPEGESTGAPDKFTGVGPLLRALSNVAALKPDDFIDQPKNLKEYGLNPDNPDRIRVEMKLKDGTAAVAYFGKMEAGAAPPPPPPIPGMPPHPPTGGTGKVYVQVEGLPGVIRASATNLGALAALIADPSPLRDRNLLNVAIGKQVDGFDVLLPGQKPDEPTKLRKVGAEWRLYGGPGDPQKAFHAAAQKIADVLGTKRIIKDFPAPDPANFASIAATLYVWVDGFNPPIAEKAEPAKRSEPVKLEFGRRVGDTVYVRRTLPGGQVNEFGLPTAVKLSATETVDLMQTVSKTRLDLLDRSLPSFSDPTRLVVTGANPYTLVKDEKIDPLTKEVLWRFTEPPAKKGQIADAAAVRNDLIYALANQSSWFDKFVVEKPTEQQLIEYGLSPPRLKVMVGTDAKSAPDVGFEYGKDTADPDKVYARVVGKPAVFTIQRRAFERFANPDLRDRVVFRQVEASKATKVVLKGWGSAGFVTELVFERNKEGAWAVTKGPPGYALAPAKVDAFLDTLARARVKSFLPGPPKGDQGFGDQKVYLLVEVTLPAGLVLQLNIGAETDKGESYFVSTSWASESVLTLDSASLREYKVSPGAFAK